MTGVAQQRVNIAPAPLADDRPRQCVAGYSLASGGTSLVPGVLF